MESKNKLTMCRLCLCENECFINIFEMDDWQGYVAAVVISDLLQFQVHETDHYPHVVCLGCLTKLTNFKEFKESCQNSRITYDNMLVSSETLVENQTDTVELITVKAEPVDYSDNEGDVSKLDLTTKEELVQSSYNEDNVAEEFVGRVASEEDKPHENRATEASDDADLDEFKEEPIEASDGAGLDKIKEEPIEASDDAGLDEFKEDPLEASDNPGLDDFKEDPIKEDCRGALRKLLRGQKGRYKCQICGRMLKTKCGLKFHLTVDHGFGKSFSCEVCGKVCASKSMLAQHAVVHTREKPYECKECRKRFGLRQSLRAHMSVHEGVKNYVCKECNKRFRQGCSLKKHMKIHIVKPHRCKTCGACFRHKGALVVHLRIHRVVEFPFKCEECSKVFSRGHYLKKHKLTHSGK